jgi:hypothetical protein
MSSGGCPILFSPVVTQTNRIVVSAFVLLLTSAQLVVLLLSLTPVSNIDGAALFYVSSKEDKNVAVLHKYLVHRAYGMPFKEAAWVVDKDAVFM